MDNSVNQFESIPGWKDADELKAECEKKIEEIKAKQEADRLERERKEEEQRIETERIAKRNKKIAIIATPIVCAVIAFIIVLNTVIIPSSKYKDALSLMNEGKYLEAFKAFENLGDYKDSEEKAALIKKEHWEAWLKTAKVGDYVYFGAYEQDNDASNGKEDVEWLVLEVKDGKALVISKYALDCEPYNTEYKEVTWETCSLRKWLNEDFLKEAFSEEENKMIATTKVTADENPEYNTNPGNDTDDKVFLLSIHEANQYFSSDEERVCKPAKYVIENGAHVGNGNCWWWLRSSGYVQGNAAYVNHVGDVREGGCDACYDDRAVRPALWIDLNS